MHTSMQGSKGLSLVEHLINQNNACFTEHWHIDMAFEGGREEGEAHPSHYDVYPFRVEHF